MITRTSNGSTKRGSVGKARSLQFACYSWSGRGFPRLRSQDPVRQTKRAKTTRVFPPVAGHWRAFPARNSLPLRLDWTVLTVQNNNIQYSNFLQSREYCHVFSLNLIEAFIAKLWVCGMQNNWGGGGIHCSKATRSVSSASCSAGKSQKLAAELDFRPSHPTSERTFCNDIPSSWRLCGRPRKLDGRKETNLPCGVGGYLSITFCWMRKKTLPVVISGYVALCCRLWKEKRISKCIMKTRWYDR